MTTVNKCFYTKLLVKQFVVWIERDLDLLSSEIIGYMQINCTSNDRLYKMKPM